MGIALYVVLGSIINIPLLAGSHIQTDLGYVAFGICCYLFGADAFVVGMIGCMFESLLTSGWIPAGWMLGQAFIGIVCGLIYTKTTDKRIHIAVTVIALIVGIVVIKTAVECMMFSIPVGVKVPKNVVAFVSDLIPMITGLLLGYRLKDTASIEEMIEGTYKYKRKGAL